MDVGWQGVVFIWLVFLWPVFISIVYLVWKGSFIARLGVFFLISVVAGYIIMVAVNFLLMIGGRFIRGDGIFIISIVAFFVPPILSTHYFSRKFELTERAQQKIKTE
ncbi:hypothetical protein EG832_06510 [bacterium]|nr:hypothetical protein [bacterium]